MEESIHRLSKLFQALGNGNRLRLLMKLQEGPHHVSELVDHINRTNNSVSHHLRILRNTDLVESETKGRKRVYWLKRPKLIKTCLGLIDFLKRD